MFTGNIKRSFYTASLAGVSFSLPLSEWLLSVFIIVMILVWIAEGGIRKTAMLLKEKKIILSFLAVYLIYMIWMVNTSDFSYGLFQLRLKLPLLFFPLAIGLSDPIGKKELKIVISSFIAGVVISSAAGILWGYGHLSPGNADPKMLSPFISHIRLALMSVFAIACSIWYFTYGREGRWHDWLFPASALWLMVFLFLLLSLTGIFLLFLLLAVSSVLIARRHVRRPVGMIIAFLPLLLIAAGASLAAFSVISFYRPGSAYIFPLITSTSGGKVYSHDPGKKDKENGNLVWIYLCEEELSREWNRHSQMNYEGNDKRGQVLKYTLIRYMTSAGLTKDSSGFAGMTATDIANVQNGITNIKFTSWSPWRSKFYELVWQLDYYRNGGNPSGHSITQRLEYFRTGIRIFLRKPLFGTGTGDLPLEYREQYEKDASVLDKPHRLLSHNQFIYFLVSFGIAGTLIIAWAFFYPFISAMGYRRYLPAVFFMLVVLSMLWEDTLETHTGVSFFAYFYSVFIFGTEYYESQNKEE